MALPHEPQPIEALRARFHAALAPVYNIDACIPDGQMLNRPGESRTHVFDMEDGRRIIISQDILYGKRHIHVSASITKEAFDKWHPRIKRKEDLITMAIEAFKLISGIQDLGKVRSELSAQCIPHLMLDPKILGPHPQEASDGLGKVIMLS